MLSDQTEWAPQFWDGELVLTRTCKNSQTEIDIDGRMLLTIQTNERTASIRKNMDQQTYELELIWNSCYFLKSVTLIESVSSDWSSLMPHEICRFFYCQFLGINHKKQKHWEKKKNTREQEEKRKRSLSDRPTLVGQPALYPIFKKAPELIDKSIFISQHIASHCAWQWHWKT